MKKKEKSLDTFHLLVVIILLIESLGKSVNYARMTSKLRKQTSNEQCDWLYLANPGY